MLKSTRLASFAAAPIAGGGAATGAVTHVTPPLQDCLKVAAADAGFGANAWLRLRTMAGR
jgi:hypothetical protein